MNIFIPIYYKEVTELSIRLFPICIPVKVDPAITSRGECRLVTVSLIFDDISSHY